MIYDRGRVDVRRYDRFKLGITLLLGVAIVLLFWQARGRPAVAAPTIQQPAAGVRVEAGELALAGLAEPGRQVAVWLDGAAVGTAPVGEGGRWSLTIVVGSAGDHELTVRLLDADGRPIGDGASLPLAVSEPVAAATPLAGPEPGDLALELPSTELQTGEIELSGTGVPGSQVEVVLDGLSIGSTTVGSGGRWSTTVTLDEPGTFGLGVRSIDARGRVLAESTPMLVKVSGPFQYATPSLELPAKVPAGGELTLKGTGTPGLTVEVMDGGEVMGTAVVGADGTWSLATVLSPGEHRLSVRMLHELGEATESGVVPVTVEAAAAPTLLVPDDIPPGGEVTLSGTGAPEAALEIVADGKVVATANAGSDGTWSTTIHLDPGEYELTVRTVAAGGAPVAESEPAALTVEAQVSARAPVIDPPPDASVGGELEWSGTAEPGAEVELLVDGQAAGRATADANGTWSITAVLAPGEHQIVARVVDSAGRSLAESEPVAYSQAAPLAARPALEAPAAGDQVAAGPVEFRGSGEPAAEIEILDGDELIGTAKAGEDSAWSAVVELAPGEHRLAVRYAGKPESQSQAVAVSVAPSVAGATPTPEPTRAVVCAGVPPMGIDRGDTYVVARCESMAVIAQRTGVRLADLIAANPQVENPALIYPGQVLNLPPRE